MFAEANKELKMVYEADPVTLDMHEQLSGACCSIAT
jgi:peptide/nickel transport system substrate-binding protein